MFPLRKIVAPRQEERKRVLRRQRLIRPDEGTTGCAPIDGGADGDPRIGPTEWRIGAAGERNAGGPEDSASVQGRDIVRRYVAEIGIAAFVNEVWLGADMKPKHPNTPAQPATATGCMFH